MTENVTQNILTQAAKSVSPKPGIKSSELWLVVITGGAISEIASRGDGPTMEQAICCLALAFIVGSYSIGRTLAKRPRA